MSLNDVRSFAIFFPVLPAYLQLGCCIKFQMIAILCVTRVKRKRCRFSIFKQNMNVMLRGAKVYFKSNVELKHSDELTGQS